MHTVSVIIPAFNCEKFIKRSIDSVLSQTVLPSEVIVVDDGSTDNTCCIAKSYGGIVRVVTQGRNCGAPSSRNFGVKNAIGNYIAILDADDEWFSEKNEISLGLLDKYCSDWCIVGQVKVSSNERVACIKNQFFQNSLENYFSLLLNNRSVCPSAFTINKSVFNEVGLFNEFLTTGEDLEMWWRIASRFPAIGYSSRPLVKYYVDVAGSMTNSRRNEEKLIAFWESVGKIQCLNNSDNQRLFVSARNRFANKALRFYWRDKYYAASRFLEKLGVVEFNFFMKFLMLIPDQEKSFICILLYRIKKFFFK